MDYEGTFADPAVREAGVVEEVKRPAAGRTRVLRFPPGFSSGRAEVRRLSPLPGEHTEEILRELGCVDEEVRRL